MEIRIEKMIYGGDGLARLPADASGRSKTVFVPFVIAGEKVSAQMVEEKAGYGRAQAGHILTPSPLRTEAGCPYFYRCGGCHYQHIGYEGQLQAKSQILRETLQRAARIDWPGEIQTHASPPWNYRNRTRMHVRAKDFAIGYFRMQSRELLPVEACPISSPLINRAIQAIWKLGRAGKVPAAVQEIEFFANAGDGALLLEVYCSFADASEEAMRDFAAAMQAELPELAGAIAFATGSSLFPWDSPSWTFGATSLEYKTRHGNYRVQRGSFFQTNRHLVETLVDLVVEGRSGRMAYDLYAGAGLFAAPLARSFERVIAVESSPPSAEDLAHNVPANVDAVFHTVEEFLRRPPETGKPELVVVDPPRAGLEPKSLRGLVRLAAPLLTYVSCDPATLSRDLRVLIESGYKVQAIHLVDLFPQTFHLESVVHLAL